MANTPQAPSNLVYNVIPPALVNGQAIPQQSDSLGNASVTLGTYLSGEDPVNNVMDVESMYKNLGNISSNTTTVTKNTPGYLKRIVINDPGSAEVITVYDNTAASGTIIAIIKPTTIGFLDYEIPLALGLTIVTTGTTAANITPIGR